MEECGKVTDGEIEDRNVVIVSEYNNKYKNIWPIDASKLKDEQKIKKSNKPPVKE